MTEKANFDVSTFIPVLRERMYSKDRYLFFVMPSLLFNIQIQILIKNFLEVCATVSGGMDWSFRLGSRFRGEKHL